jgi:hypothetical protein
MNEENNPHDWVGAIRTVDGSPFSLTNPDPAAVDIQVIAHSLSLQCRFNGHVPTFYSVAEHCVRVAALYDDRELQLHGLLHDAAEAYIGDIVRPMKLMRDLGAAYSRLEEAVELAVGEALGVTLTPMRDEIADADRAVFQWETDNIRTGIQPGWPPEYARERFLAEYEALTQ